MPEKQSFPHQQSTQGRLGKEEQISRAAKEGWEPGAVWGGIIKDEVRQKRTAKKSLPVVRQSHK